MTPESRHEALCSHSLSHILSRIPNGSRLSTHTVERFAGKRLVFSIKSITCLARLAYSPAPVSKDREPAERRPTQRRSLSGQLPRNKGYLLVVGKTINHNRPALLWHSEADGGDPPARSRLLLTWPAWVLMRDDDDELV